MADKQESKKPEVDFAAIIRGVSPEKFDELFAAAPRAARTAIAKRYGIKKPPLFSPGSVKDRRSSHAHKVQEAFLEEGDPKLCEELIRNWLFARRPLLGAALDYMKIPHQNGLTEEDLTPLEELSAKGVKQLQEHLGKSFPAEDINIYLRFVGVKHV